MQKLGDGQETPRSAFAVGLGFVLASTRKLTWLDRGARCVVDAALALGACVALVDEGTCDDGRAQHRGDA